MQPTAARDRADLDALAACVWAPDPVRAPYTVVTEATSNIKTHVVTIFRAAALL
jgi:hypothetical protein